MPFGTSEISTYLWYVLKVNGFVGSNHVDKLL